MTLIKTAEMIMKRVPVEVPGRIGRPYYNHKCPNLVCPVQHRPEEPCLQMQGSVMATYPQAVARLIAARRHRGLRQNEVEEMAGLPHNYLTALERMKKVAEVPTFLRWCAALEINPFCLHTEAKDGTEGTS